MKKYVLALSLFISALAIAQPPADKPEDKPKDKSVSNEHKKKKPEEKKDKKPRTFRLIGLEASTGNQYYASFENSGAPSSTSSIYHKFLPDDSPFFTYFGDNTPTNNGYSPLYAADYAMYNDRWNSFGGSTDFTTTWGFGKKGDVNQKHVIKIGGGFSDRSYRVLAYSFEEYSDRDTLGYTYIGSDTSVTIKDTSVYVTTQLSNYANLGHILLGYNYRIHPEEKLSLSFGGGMDIAFGTYSVFGDIYRHNDSYVASRPINDGPGGWTNYDYQNSIHKTTLLANIDEKKFKVATFRPYITARVDYRLSKNIPVLKGINLFVEGRYGVEYSNINKIMYSRAPSYLSLKFGVAVNFRKGL